MVAAWKDVEAFGDGNMFTDLVEISCGDIFDGAPATDAIVSPANSFGFMDGGIDMVYSHHFGWQLQDRLQDLLRRDYSGELPVGCAVVLPAYDPNTDLSKKPVTASKNEGRLISYVVSAPTMRIPSNVSKTVNAYLAFRAILRAVLEHNKNSASDKIRTVLCPGLGTAVGRMPYKRCAIQMRTACEAVLYGNIETINYPPSLKECCTGHDTLMRAGGDSGTAFGAKAEKGSVCNCL